MRHVACLALLLAACGSRAMPPTSETPSVTPTTAADPPSVEVPPPPTAWTPPVVRPLPTSSRPADEPPPGATPQLVPPPRVHVTLTKPSLAGHGKVTVKGAWALVSADDETLRVGAGLDGELALGATGATLAGAPFPDDAELRPKFDGDLRVDGRTYPGALRVERGADGKRRAMDSLDVESYVAVVVSSEIPAAFPREAQRVQAIVARTYALASTARTSPAAPLLLMDVGGADQEFNGIAPVAEHRRIGLDAATSTRGIVLVDGGAPFVAYYHSTCGGTTCPGAVAFGKAGAAAPLAGGVACSWCTGSKYFKWDAKIGGAAVVKAAGLTGALESFVVAEKTAGGRAQSFHVKSGGKTKRVLASDFRVRVGASTMRSVLLDDAAVSGGELVLRGRGWGHGVGLCQMGAKTLAEQGRDAEAVLGLYYPGAKLERRW
jgi:stage II sporulation protein D